MGVSNFRLLELPVQGGRTCELRLLVASYEMRRLRQLSY